MTDDSVPTNSTGETASDPELRSHVAELEAELEKERNQATDYMKRWQYAQAELANVRRRGQQERDDLAKYGIAPLAATLLEVLDNFDRAEQAIPATLQSFTWISGVILIHRQLEYVLQQHGLEPIAAAGQPYDPAVHEALAQEHHESVPEGTVIAEVQRGYKLHGRLLRPALVRVSQGPAPAPEGTPGPEASEAVQGTPPGEPAREGEA
jgi:molecular chaperone GrpE